MLTIRPTPILDAQLVSSTVAETDHAAWSAATAYAAGDKVIRTSTHRIYQRVTSGTTATAPELDTVHWVDIAPTNRWAMFDGVVGSVTTASDSLTVVLAPGRINALALLAVDASTVAISLVVDSATVYSASLDLDSGVKVGNWYDYFYEPVYVTDTVVVTDLLDAALLDIPAYGEGQLTVTLTRTGGTVSLGCLVVGLSVTLGTTLEKPVVSITDYSRKTTDDYGNVTVTRRAYSKRMNAEVVVQQADVDNVVRVLTQYRSTPLVWVAAGNLFSCLIVYGFCKDWSLPVGRVISQLHLEIEGLT